MDNFNSLVLLGISVYFAHMFIPSQKPVLVNVDLGFPQYPPVLLQLLKRYISNYHYPTNLLMDQLAGLKEQNISQHH